MSRILTSFPGKLGDIMWSLPAIREISRQAGEPVDLIIGGKYSPILELLKLQPYLNQVTALEGWEEGDFASWEPQVNGSYEKVYHLRYEWWPSRALPIETYHQAIKQGAVKDQALLTEVPWITLPPIHQPSRQDIYLGWTDEWFELKLGLSWILDYTKELPELVQVVPRGSRWDTETECLGSSRWSIYKQGWLETAAVLASCKLYVGCLSAQWVLANALGVPCVVCEPNQARHNPIFWWDGPMEKDGKPRNRMVMGNDGKPTWDARALVQTIKEELERER